MSKIHKADSGPARHLEQMVGLSGHNLRLFRPLQVLDELIWFSVRFSASMHEHTCPQTDRHAQARERTYAHTHKHSHIVGSS